VSENIGEDPVAAAKRQIEEVTPEQVLEMQEKTENVVYLDVREPREWNLGHLPQAVHIPLGNLEAKVRDVIPLNQRVVIYCARGNRSALAALAMKRMGYAKVASMARGITGWVAINGDVEG
jgi:sulfur-carrier protein adenylyltransferase/sulfurtransferase